MGATDAPADESIHEQFSEQGFLHVPGVLTAEEVAHFRPIVEAGVRSRRAGDDRSLDEKTTYEQSFLQCINLWEDVPEIRPLTFHPAIGELAAKILGTDAVRVWHDQALCKEPGGRGTDPHQDQPYWPVLEPATVTAWIPLVDVPMEMGAMGYVPGSHRFGIREFANIFTGQGFDLTNGPEARGVEPVFVPVEVGDVIFHHGLTIHTAGANDADRMRWAHTVIFFADGSTRSERPRRHPSVDRAKIAVGGADPLGVHADRVPASQGQPAGHPAAARPAHAQLAGLRLVHLATAQALTSSR